MTTTETQQAGAVGVTVHFIASGMTVASSTSLSGSSRVMRYGDELLVTPDLRAANTDRHGVCALDLDEEQQVRRFGRVHYRPGAWPEGVSRLEPGSQQQAGAREAARRAAHRIEDDVQRAAALRQVEMEYGRAATTSVTLTAYGDHR